MGRGKALAEPAGIGNHELKSSSMTASRRRPCRFAWRTVALDALLVLLVGLSLVPAAAAQNRVQLTPAQSTANAGALDIALDLQIDFAEITLGGGVEVSYDATRLEFVSFTFSGDPNFGLTGPADGDPTQPIEIGAGWAIFGPPGGVTGLHTIGTFRFRAIGSGSAAISTAASPTFPGPFFSPSSGGPMVVLFESATIQVAPAAVPAWNALARLICGALLCLIGIRRMSR